ncbi:unnamed protein product [Schistocephalus solidus]|uniref:N-acetyltransferase domain-containing protein n=1 Tax=Schistocephalus solidus TaxID=70667 RepID=A0A183TIC5_SCHSO|nr:unnamed protein product [Schistocephalus solidus]
MTSLLNGSPKPVMPSADCRPPYGIISDPTKMTTATTDNNFIDVPPPTITDTILHPLRRLRLRTTLASISPPQRPLPTTCYLQHHCRPQFQRWGLGTNLSSLRSHIHLTHRPGRSLANPSHRDWRASAWSTNTQQRPPPPMPSLPTRIRSSHGPDRSHAHPRKRNPPRCQHILPTHKHFP